MRLIDADEFERRIKKYDTTDYADKALYNFAHNEMITTPTVCDIEQIRAEIEKPLRVERYADTESAKAQAIALSWCLEVIDKYTK